MRVVVAGSSGFLGQAWSAALTDQGHEVVRLVRRAPRGPGEVEWDPATGSVDPEVVETADVVANLAGAPLVRLPWTASYRRAFVASRIESTRVLAEAVARSSRKPAFLAQNGVAGYGDRGTEVVTETDPTDADTFMADVTRRWQDAAAPASEAGVRVVVLRTSVVLHRSGGALGAMLPAFRLGLGGPLGNGRQYFPTISLHDWVRAATWLALTEEASGAYNVTGPDCSTNAEFTAALAAELRRPAVVRVPAWPLRKVGPIGSEVLASQRLEPRRLLDAGFAFAHDHVTTRVQSALRTRSPVDPPEHEREE